MLTGLTVPVFSISSGVVVDTAALSRLASAGAVIDLNTDTTESALPTLSVEPLRVTGASQLIRDAEPPLPATVSGRLLIRGYLDALPEKNLDFEQYSLRELHSWLRATAEAQGIRVVDLLDAYRGEDVASLQQQTEGWFDPWHPNARGNRIAAEALERAILAAGWVKRS